MSDMAALSIAIDLLQAPSRVRWIRSKPLPDGVIMLLRVAAGDDEAEKEATELTGRSREVIQQAATFFIEQILFSHNADSYHVLGANRHATNSELRRNMALLLRWLHPDMDSQGERSVFATRVTAAWNNLKTPERRAAYDRAQSLRARQSPHRGQDGVRTVSSKDRANRRGNNAPPQYRRRKSHSVYRIKRSGLLWRALMFFLGNSRANN